jgi:hypothetical protein
VNIIPGAARTGAGTEEVVAPSERLEGTGSGSSEATGLGAGSGTGSAAEAVVNS